MSKKPVKSMVITFSEKTVFDEKTVFFYAEKRGKMFRNVKKSEMFQSFVKTLSDK